MVVVRLPPVVDGGGGSVPTMRMGIVCPLTVYEPVKFIAPVAGSNVPDKNGVAMTRRLFVPRVGSTICRVPDAVFPLEAAVVRLRFPISPLASAIWLAYDRPANEAADDAAADKRGRPGVGEVPPPEPQPTAANISEEVTAPAKRSGAIREVVVFIGYSFRVFVEPKLLICLSQRGLASRLP